MSKNEFCQKIIEELQDRMDPDIKVSLHTVRKNNNVILQGVIIQNPKQNISPTIYLERFFDMYQEGTSIEVILDQVLDVYENGCPKKSIEMDFFKDFDKVKDRVVYRLINAEKNKELLKEIPHILFMDLAVCFYYAFWDSDLGEGMIMIHNSHMDLWKCNHLQLMKLAKQNTPRLFPAEYMGLNSVVAIMSDEETEVKIPGVGLHVLSNKQRCQGAACILYQGELEKIAERIDGSFYILPSSVHEVIILKDIGDIDIKALRDMIREVNETQLSPEEILSDHPYYYDRIKSKITCLSNI